MKKDLNYDAVRQALNEAGLPHIPVFKLEDERLPERPKVPVQSEAEKRKIQLDCIQISSRNRGK